MQALNPEICRKARLARDPRFDGEFFLAVTSTGIYCRPICPARAPREDNVRYFRTAAEAAGNGFRPCLRCRPESAPDSPAWRGTSTTVGRALQLINEGALNQGTTGQLAGRLGVGERYLRKLFEQQLGASPSAIAHTRRAHFAQQLLRETGLDITEVAYASGFGSVRRFNSSVAEQFGCTPRQLRERGHPRAGAGGNLALQLSYRPPLDWQALLHFFTRHAIDGLEGVDGNYYWRNFHTGGQPGRFQVGPGRRENTLALEVELADTRQLMPLVARVRRMFDLDANPEDIAAGLGEDPLLHKLMKSNPGVRSPVHFSAFESCMRGIVGQQISLQAARKVLARLLAACGNSGDFPAPAQLAALPDSALPMPTARKATLRNACQVFQGDVGSPDEICEQLGALRGIGPWTLEMLRMRGFADPDIFPTRDLGLVKALAAHGVEKDQQNKHCELWRPWRSYAANLLWRTLA